MERVFDLLWSLLETSCEVAISKEQSAPESSHLRLAAAQSMIKLTHMPAYERHLSVSQFEHLALTVQVSVNYNNIDAIYQRVFFRIRVTKYDMDSHRQ